jgi:capsular polysaccharide biosynthesis protein/Mrp family chromosome partitioning ATPase
MSEPGQPSPELGDYFAAVRRRWWFVLVLAVVGLALGAAYAKVAPKTYQSTASVYVTATGTTANQLANSRTAAGTVNLDSEAQVAQSAQVASMAGKAMHSTLSPQALAKQVNVTVPANSQVLLIACQAGSATGAATCAQSFAHAYLQYTSATTSQSLKNQLSALQSRINGLQKQAGKLSSAIASLPVNSPERGADESLLAVDKSQLNQYSNTVVTLTAEQADSSSGYIISNAVAPAKPTSPSKTLAWGGGLVVGLLLGLIGALWWDRTDRRVRGPRDVMRLGLPVLPGLPLKGRSRAAVEMAPAKSPAGKAFTGLAYSIAAALGEDSHVIVVTGAASGQGGSLVAANLAAGLARTQPKVTLVCANLQGSVIPRISGIAPNPGVAELMTGRISAGEAELTDSGVPRLTVITPGVEGVHDAAIQQDTMERLLNVLRREARFIVVEAPPLAEAADVYALAPLADAAVVVAEVGRDAGPRVRDGAERLEQLGTHVLGVVLLPALHSASDEMYAAGRGARPVRPTDDQATLSLAVPRSNHSGDDQNEDEPEPISGQATGPVIRS